MCLIPKNFQIWTSLNQGCSSLSRGTTISVRLNSSNLLLLLLEVFNKESWEDISFIELIPQTALIYKKAIWWERFFGGQAYQIFVSSYLMFTRLHERFLALSSYSSFRNFSISFSLYSGLHQSHHLDGCNPTRDNFLAIHFLMSCVVCIYYVTWQDHLLDPKILGTQHVSSPLHDISCSFV